MDTKNFCPVCGSAKIITIIYGAPTEEELEAERWGELEIVEGLDDGVTSPNRRCTSCGYVWRDDRRI